MERIIFFDESKPSIDYHSRTATVGEELNLVQHFVDYYCAQFIRYNKVQNLAVFFEPRIASGFPDLVLASYTPDILNNWSTEREDLTPSDLKLLTHLIKCPGSCGQKIMAALQFPEKQVLCSLEKLLDANMILRKSGGWQPLPLNNVYGIKKLVSIEAKMNNSSRVIEQSFANTWFASQSYALTNVAIPQTETVKKFEHSGIGLYCKPKGFKKMVEAKRLSLPSSYVSLQFNEWIGKALIA